jgi:hypothetical protein
MFVAPTLWSYADTHIISNLNREFVFFSISCCVLVLRGKEKVYTLASKPVGPR